MQLPLSSKAVAGLLQCKKTTADVIVKEFGDVKISTEKFITPERLQGLFTPESPLYLLGAETKNHGTGERRGVRGEGADRGDSDQPVRSNLRRSGMGRKDED